MFPSQREEVRRKMSGKLQREVRKFESEARRAERKVKSAIRKARRGSR